MSSYIDHKRPVRGPAGQYTYETTHSWADFTDARLAWLYGPDHAQSRGVRTAADVAAWNRLGESRRPAA